MYVVFRLQVVRKTSKKRDGKTCEPVGNIQVGEDRQPERTQGRLGVCFCPADRQHAASGQGNNPLAGEDKGGKGHCCGQRTGRHGLCGQGSREEDNQESTLMETLSRTNSFINGSHLPSI